MNAIEKFKRLAAAPRFQGWPIVGESQLGPKIDFFGQALNYQLQTPAGVENYTSILRHFGWAVVFGVTADQEVITLCQWKPGVNRASWELPPGGIGKVSPNVTLPMIEDSTYEAYLKETGYSDGTWSYLGHVMIETGKYRGAGPDDHGLPAHLFLIRDLRRIMDARRPAANEIMETIMVPLSEFWDVIDSGLFTETSAVACALLALRRLKM